MIITILIYKQKSISMYFNEFYLLFAFILINVFDALGYGLRHRMFKTELKNNITLFGYDIKLSSMLSHCFQMATIVTAFAIIILPDFFSVGNVNYLDSAFTLFSMRTWFIVYSFVCIRLFFYDIVYNKCVNQSIFYNSDSSFTGRIILWLYDHIGVTPTFVFRFFILMIPFFDAINAL